MPRIVSGISRHMTLKERFEAHIGFFPFHTCWEWLGSKNNKGYGEIRGKTRHSLAHRLSFEFYKGPIPSDKLIRHTCDNPSCVNPEHLILGTQKENVADSLLRKRQHFQTMTHCKSGHILTPENVRIYNGHYRRCLVCERAWNKARIRKKS